MRFFSASSKSSRWRSTSSRARCMRWRSTGSRRRLLGCAPGFGGFDVIVKRGVRFRQRLPIRRVAAVERENGFQQLDPLPGIGFALGQQEARLGLRRRDFDGPFERRRIGFGQQRLVFGEQFALVSDHSEFLPHVFGRNRFLGEIPLRAHRPAAWRSGGKIAAGEIFVDLGFDLDFPFSESVAIGRVVFGALLQVVEQDRKLAEILRIDGQQMHAGPIAIALRRRNRLAQRNADTGNFERAEQRDQSALEIARHAVRVRLDQQLRQTPLELCGLGIGGKNEHDMLALDLDRIGRAVGSGFLLGLEEQDLRRRSDGQIRLAQDLSKRVPKLLQMHELGTAGPGPGVGKQLKAVGAHVDPRQQRARQDGKAVKLGAS